jgi:Spy/CpxP family protein refolding chaperone
MKLHKLLPIVLILVSATVFSQPRFREKMEQIKSLKVAYITDALELTPDEASKFWPIYNAYDDKQKELRQEKIRGYLDRMDADEINKMSDKEANNFLAQMENTEDELYQLRKKFITNLKGILPARKIIKLKKAEEGFNRKLLRQYRDKNPKE